jgi:glycosyltransferase involved in cell wall biosynthesis
VYNSAIFLYQALESLSNQTFTDFELIAVDDGSTDESFSVLSRHAQRDSRLEVFRQRNFGGAVARNRAAGQAVGKYLALADADDVAVSDRLEKQIAYMEADESVAVLGGGAQFINEHDELLLRGFPPTSPEEVRKYLTRGMGSCIYDSTVIIRHADFAMAGGYRPQFWVAYDYDLWLRLLPARMANLPDIVTFYRQHPSQITQKRAELRVFSAVTARASYESRLHGSPDPAAIWDGSVDLALYDRIDIDAFLLASLHARLMFISHSRGNCRRLKYGSLGHSGFENCVLERLATVSLSGAQLSGDVGPLIRSCRCFLEQGRYSDGLRLLIRVIRRYPWETCAAFTNLIARRVGGLWDCSRTAAKQKGGA